jgi:catalase
VIAPAVGGVTASNGNRIEAQQKIGGGPSVLYDAVAVIPSEEGVQPLLKNAAAKDFVSDAFAHLKVIGYVDAAMPLFEKAGIAADMDEGFVPLAKAKGTVAFVTACRKLRIWPREQIVTT